MFHNFSGIHPSYKKNESLCADSCQYKSTHGCQHVHWTRKINRLKLQMLWVAITVCGKQQSGIYKHKSTLIHWFVCTRVQFRFLDKVKFDDTLTLVILNPCYLEKLFTFSGRLKRQGPLYTQNCYLLTSSQQSRILLRNMTDIVVNEDNSCSGTLGSLSKFSLKNMASNNQQK